eukprot:evm.model.scf_285EXC.15 EVM.evm.TU.scf_285EXC.15   scf_285EXC:103851-105116(+)
MQSVRFICCQDWRAPAATQEASKGEMRSAFFRTSQPVLATSKDEFEHVGHYRGAPLVFTLLGDLVFYCLGSGEYEELACKSTSVPSGSWNVGGMCVKAPFSHIETLLCLALLCSCQCCGFGMKLWSLEKAEICLNNVFTSEKEAGGGDINAKMPLVPRIGNMTAKILGAGRNGDGDYSRLPWSHCPLVCLINSAGPAESLGINQLLFAVPVAEVIYAIVRGLRDVLSTKALTEQVLFENYALVCLTLDEIIYEVSKGTYDFSMWLLFILAEQCGAAIASHG